MIFRAQLQTFYVNFIQYLIDIDYYITFNVYVFCTKKYYLNYLVISIYANAG